MEQSTVSIDKKTLGKLSVIAQKSGLTKTVIITAYIDALYQLVNEGQESDRISLTNFEIDLVHSTIKQGYANLFDISELPQFIRDFFACQLRIENEELNGKLATKEELLKTGFNEADIDILLAEQKARFEKKVKA